MPGERELDSAARYAETGIPLATSTFAGLEALAAELELDHPLAPIQEGIPP
jgi:LDH2 family malate/lactate/ureidoglycolate dehydrogenase